MDNALNRLSYGLFVLSSKLNEKNNACIINTAVQLMSNPETLSICVNKSNFTHDMILQSGVFTLSVVSQNANFDLFKHFGFSSGRDNDKFADFEDYLYDKNGIPYITSGTNAYISVNVIKSVDMGTHTLFIGNVTESCVTDNALSATYEYYQNNIKPQPQQNKNVKTVWRCTVCGYEYEEDELPADFVCPWCKHPASDFVKK